MKITFNWVDKIIFILAIIFTITLLGIQLFRYDTDFTIYTSKLNKEHRKLLFLKTENDKKGLIVLKNITGNNKNTQILLNGNSVGNFSNNDEIRLGVYHNDILEVDSTNCNSEVLIKIVDISNNIEDPKLNKTFKTTYNIELLERIQLK